MPDNHDVATVNRKGLAPKLSGSDTDVLLGTGAYGTVTVRPRFTNDFARYDSDPVLVDNSLSGTIPGGTAWINGKAVTWSAFSITLAANKLRRYYISAASAISYDEVAVTDYSTVTRRQPQEGLAYIYLVTSDDDEITSILQQTDTYPTKVWDDHAVGTIEMLLDIFYLNTDTANWTATTAVIYGDLLVNTTGNVYLVTTGGTTGGSQPTTTDPGYITDGSAILVFYGHDAYSGAFRYGQSNAVDWYFSNIGLEEIIHMKTRSASSLGVPTGTTVASLVKNYLKIAMKHLCVDFYSGGTYLRGMKLITDGWYWLCTTAGTVAATNVAFTAAAPHSLNQTVTSGTAVWKAVYQHYSTHNWVWLRTLEDFQTYRYPDSHDSYAATFVSLLARYIEVTDDYSWLNDASPQPSLATYKDILDIIIYANLDTQLQNFLSRSFQENIFPLDGSSFTTQYFMDNCETVKSYKDAAYIYNLLGDTVRRDAAIASEDYVADNGIYPMFDTTYNLWEWYFGDTVSTWVGDVDLQFYPYVMAQHFADKCNLDIVKEHQQYANRMATWDLYSNCLTDRGKDSFPQNWIGLIAVRKWRDPVLAQSFVDISERYHVRSGINFIISEYACYLRLKELLININEIMVSDANSLIIHEKSGTVKRLMVPWTSWTPTRTSWTDVGSPTVTARYCKIGGIVSFQIKVVPGTTVATVAGTSYTSLPVTAAGLAGDASMMNLTTLIGIGNGVIDVTNSRCYVPTQTATGNTLTISGRYEA